MACTALVLTIEPSPCPPPPPSHCAAVQALRWVFGFNKDVIGGVHSLSDEHRTVRRTPPAPLAARPFASARRARSRRELTRQPSSCVRPPLPPRRPYFTSRATMV